MYILCHKKMPFRYFSLILSYAPGDGVLEGWSVEQNEAYSKLTIGSQSLSAPLQQSITFTGTPLPKFVPCPIILA